jgi:serine/threonine-protein kinase
MALEPGKQLGSFEISRMLGVGGMGEVYCAHDSKLDRDVAIKVLPEVFALDAERLGRFKREARLLASLDHPNVCAVYDLYEEDGAQFMIMPLIEGDTLADRIESGPIPAREALPIFVQIAEALEAAHEQGIIHRDLKPGNIKVSEDGKVKVLDFGLGKSVEYENETVSSEAPTRATMPDSTKMSQEGVILGTPGYMSPEQARGKAVDKRTDIWAFGCCLYEALTGTLPFEGETVSDTLAKILERDPDWDRLPPDTPPEARVLLRKCLQKDSTRRLRDIGDARIDVLDFITESGRVKAAAYEPAPQARRSYLLAASVALGAVIIAAALILVLRTEVPPFESEPVRRYSISLSPDAPLKPLNERDGGAGLVLSRDGLLLVYVAQTGPNQRLIFLRRLDQLDDAQPIAGTENAVSAFFSPDGQWIGFFTHDKLKKVSVQGGYPITLCDISNDLGASWGEDGHIVFSSEFGQGLKRISAAGGPVEDLMDKALMESHGFFAVAGPVALPGGNSVLFTAIAGFSMNDFRIAALTLASGEVKFLLDRAVPATYHPTGHLIYLRERAMMAAPFDPGGLEITGPAVPVTEERMELQPTFDFPTRFALSSDGTLVYALGSEDPLEVPDARTLVWVDREGKEDPLEAPSRPYGYVDLSPDGTRAAVLFTDPEDLSNPGDIWILDLTREPVTQQRLTFNPQAFCFPLWTPDNQRVVFGSVRDRTFSLSSKAADGTGPVQSLHTSKNPLIASTWSADGRSLIFMEATDRSNSDIWALSLDGETAARSIMAESYNEVHPAISPDGRWIAYMSDESGVYNVYIRPFPNVDDGKWLISARAGGHLIWAPDGRELYYDANPDEMMVVTIETEPAFTAGNPEVLFRGEYVMAGNRGPDASHYDISPDGQRFLMIKEDSQAREAAKPVETAPITDVIVVENWDEVLKGITPVVPEN